MSLALGGSHESKAEKIASLNDRLREEEQGGSVEYSNDIFKHPKANEIIDAVKNSTSFDSKEHDFGVVNIEGEEFFWRINCYEKGKLVASRDRSNQSITSRVLQIRSKVEIVKIMSGQY